LVLEVCRDGSVGGGDAGTRSIGAATLLSAFEAILGQASMDQPSTTAREFTAGMPSGPTGQVGMSHMGLSPVP
jgi:hypothetical protein